MQSKILSNVMVEIKDEANKLVYGLPNAVKFSINADESEITVEKVVEERKPRERGLKLRGTKHGAGVSFKPNAKKIHIYWDMDSDTIKNASEAELRNEMLIVFDRAMEELKKIDL